MSLLTGRRAWVLAAWLVAVGSFAGPALAQPSSSGYVLSQGTAVTGAAPLIEIPAASPLGLLLLALLLMAVGAWKLR